jgi:hypothetical protein
VCLLRALEGSGGKREDEAMGCTGSLFVSSGRDSCRVRVEGFGEGRAGRVTDELDLFLFAYESPVRRLAKEAMMVWSSV